MYNKNMTLEEWQVAANIATIIASVVAIIALIYIAKQAHATSDIIKQNFTKDIKDQTNKMLERYNDSSYQNYLHNAMLFLGDESLSINQKKEKLKEKSGATNELLISLKMTLNFFEELGMKYNNNEIDQTMIKDFMKTATLDYYNKSKWFIDKVRRVYNSETLYEHWEKMNEHLKK